MGFLVFSRIPSAQDHFCFQIGCKRMVVSILDILVLPSTDNNSLHTLRIVRTSWDVEQARSMKLLYDSMMVRHLLMAVLGSLLLLNSHHFLRQVH